MRRHWAAALLALLVILQLVYVPTTAASTVYFTAVNETVLELSDATMPFWSDGYLYVANSVFSNGELGLSYSYSSLKQKAVVYSTQAPSHALIFSMADDTVSDTDTNNYDPPALLRGGVVFVPVGLISTYFGLRYTRVSVTHGYLVRMRNGSSALPDNVFLDLATSQLNNRYNQYQKKNDTSSSGPSGGAASPPTSPPATTQTPAVTQKPEEEEPEELAAAEGKQITLCFQVSDEAQATALLNLLEETHSYGAFYFPVEQLSQYSDLLRRLSAEGQTIGLIADGVAGSVVEQLNRGNRSLAEATGAKTRFVWLEGETDSAAAVAAGYCQLIPSLNRAADGLHSPSNASYLLGRIGGQRGERVTVWLADQVSVAGLRPLLSAALEGNNAFQGMTETGA